MEITEVKIRKLYHDRRMKALVSVTLDDCFALHDIKVIEGDERIFIAMPSRKDDNGVFRDIAHPMTPEMRKYMEKTILTAYYRQLEIEVEFRVVEETPVLPAAKNLPSPALRSKKGGRLPQQALTSYERELSSLFLVGVDLPSVLSVHQNSKSPENNRTSV